MRNALQMTGLVMMVAMGATAMPGCSVEPIEEAKGEKSSAQVEGGEKILELTTSGGDRSGTNIWEKPSQIQVCETEGPNYDAIMDFRDHPETYARAGDLGFAVLLHRRDGDQMVSVLELPAPDNGGCYAMPVETTPEDFRAQIQTALKGVFNAAFAADFGGITCDIGVAFASPAFTFGGDLTFDQSGLHLPETKFEWSQPDVTGQVGCVGTIPLPSPNPAIINELGLELGAHLMLTSPGKLDVLISRQESYAKMVSGPPSGINFDVAVNARILQVFFIKGGINVAFQRANVEKDEQGRDVPGCSLSTQGTLTFKVEGGISPKFKFTNSFSISGEHPYQFTIAPSCPAGEPAEPPPAEPPPAEPPPAEEFPSCESGDLSSDFTLCGRSFGTETTLFRCIQREWHVERQCESFCDETPGVVGQDYCR